MMNATGNQMIQIMIHGRPALATPENAKVLLRKNDLVLKCMKLRWIPNPSAEINDEISAITRKIISLNRKIQREGIHCFFQ